MTRTRWIEAVLLGASLLALMLLVWRDAGIRGVEIEVRDPPRGVDATMVQVAGAVASPGLVTVPPGGRVGDAVALAGGFVEAADPAALNLARRVLDGERIDVPRLGDAAVQPVDLNHATPEELAALPGIGAGYATRIVDARRVAPFESSDDLVLRGILPLSLYADIRDLVATP